MELGSSIRKPVPAYDNEQKVSYFPPSLIFTFCYAAVEPDLKLVIFAQFVTYPSLSIQCTFKVTPISPLSSLLSPYLLCCPPAPDYLELMHLPFPFCTVEARPLCLLVWLTLRLIYHSLKVILHFSEFSISYAFIDAS